MSFEGWILVFGVVFVVVAVCGSFLRELPLTAAMLYFLVGVGLGPVGLNVLTFDPVGGAPVVERLAEVAVIVALFTTGLKLRVPLRDGLWWVPVRLAFISMTLTVGLVAAAGVWLLGLPLGAAVLLGAVLAPTDPVLAAEVQVRHAGDREPVRFALTGEAGLNDGTAFPFVMLGLGLMGLHELGEWGWRWALVDGVWAVGAGLAFGALSGTLVAKLILFLRRRHREGVGYDEFLALGLIGLSYGGALMIEAYGFLAVFAAGLALRAVERRHSGDGRAPQKVLGEAGEDEEAALHPDTAPAHMTQTALAFNEQLERLIEVGMVLLVGAMLSLEALTWAMAGFVAVTLLAVRPFAASLGLIGAPIDRPQLGLIAWLGIRGIGSLYYLMFAIRHGVPDDLARQLVDVTVTVVAVSVFLHGASATPLMRLYGRRTAG